MHYKLGQNNDKLQTDFVKIILIMVQHGSFSFQMRKLRFVDAVIYSANKWSYTHNGSAWKFFFLDEKTEIHRSCHLLS